MDFNTYLHHAWTTHGEDPEGVFDSLEEGLSLATSPQEIVSWSSLTTHVAGEHLARFDEGDALLERAASMELLAQDDLARRTIHRSRAVLLLTRGDHEAADVVLSELLDPRFPEASSRIRALTNAASAMATHGDVEHARNTFDEALSLASYAPDKEDPASRALAIHGNNIAMALEEHPARGDAHDALMVLAARTSRTWWAIAGDATNVLLADVRVASALIASGDAEEAMSYAKAAVDASAGDEVLAGYRIQAMLVFGHASAALGDEGGVAEAVREAQHAFRRLPEAYHDYYRPKIDALAHQAG